MRGEAALAAARLRAVCAAALGVALGLWLCAAPLRAELSLTPDEGLVWKLPEQQLRADLDGRLALSYYEYDSRNARSDRLRIEPAWLGGSLVWRERAELRAVFDLVGIDTRDGLYEAWAAYELAPFLRATAGLQPIALGVEGGWPEAARPLPGMPGFVAFLTSRSDLALRVEGEVAEGIFSYDVAAAAGEGFDLFGQRLGSPQLSGVVDLHPLQWLDWELTLGPYRFPLLSGLFGHAGYAWSPDFHGHMDVATPLRNKLFRTARLDGDRTSSWVVGYGLDLGPIRAVHEFTRVALYGVRTPEGEKTDLEELTAWQVLVSWRISGEPYDSRPVRARGHWRGALPARPLCAKAGERGPGALELAFRYANGDIDRDFFGFGFTDFDDSSQEFRVAAVGLNWDPCSWLRVSGEVARTIADNHPAVFDSHGRDTSGLVRVELRF
jgi:hypothetical protein